VVGGSGVVSAVEAISVAAEEDSVGVTGPSSSAGRTLGLGLAISGAVVGAAVSVSVSKGADEGDHGWLMIHGCGAEALYCMPEESAELEGVEGEGVRAVSDGVAMVAIVVGGGD